MTRKMFALAIIALIVATPHSTALAQQPAKAPGPTAQTQHSIGIGRKLQLEGVANFGEVTPSLYRGAQPTKEGFDNLAKMGISIVVDLRGQRASERSEATKLGMQYISIPWQCSHPRNAIFAEFLLLVRGNPDKKIFVHCHFGADRTGMMIAAYRMGEQGWSAEEAKKEMQAYGFSFTHHMICPGLASYEKNFPGEFNASPAFQSLHPAERAPEPQPRP